MNLPHDLNLLAKLLEKDEPRLVVAVGAGVAMGATSAPHASWLGLLKHGVAHLVETSVFSEGQGKRLLATLDTAFSPFNLQSALRHAEVVELNLKVPDEIAFARWLESAFTDFRALPERRMTLDRLRDLQRAGALLLTTNYDSLLSDVTGVPPVTWEEHDEFLQVIRRERPGILHIHGHWQRSNSVILGQSSYDRITSDRLFQDLFKSLWLEWSWLYVGFGNGLNDPNFHQLLKWGDAWRKDAPPDYFLSQTDQAWALSKLHSSNLICVGYSDHANLPDLLRSLTPAAHCWPFIPVNSEFPLFRNPASPVRIPFPSWQEYIDGAVPTLPVDDEVQQRIEKYRWAFILDEPSVGKTTLAMRMATALAQRDHAVFYLDLATIYTDEAAAGASAVLPRLARPSSLLILDNVHHQPELARQLWDQWRQCSRDSKMLLIATRTQRAIITTATQDLTFFEHHVTNPAVDLHLTPSDLRAIVVHLYRRTAGSQELPLHDPPADVLERWHHNYGHAVGAFCIAVLSRLADFQHDHWDLPLDAASDWVREKWLSGLEAKSVENVISLAVFGEQELEMEIPREALPNPRYVDQLLRSGLVMKMERGSLGQHERFTLREPAWGALLLASQDPPPDAERILFETAARHPTLARLLAQRLRTQRLLGRFERLFEYLTDQSKQLLALLSQFPLTESADLAKLAVRGGRPQLAITIWDAIDREPDEFARRVWTTPLRDVASFLAFAGQHGRDCNALWAALEKDEPHLTERLRDAPLDHVAYFLDTAKLQQRSIVPLWERVEREPDRLVQRAWNISLNYLARFLNIARMHGRDTTVLWTALENYPARLVQKVLEAPLGYVAHFLDTAQRHQRNVSQLWAEIEREPRELLVRARKTSLKDIASFLAMAHQHGRDVARLWTALENEPAIVAEILCEAPLDYAAHFFETAQRHGRSVGQWWEIIELEPEQLARRVAQSQLKNISAFIEVASRQRRNLEMLWTIVESAPTTLAAGAWKTASISDLAGFLDVAGRHGRDTTSCWAALASDPAVLAERAWDAPLGNVGSFIKAAGRNGHDVTAFLHAFESRPTKVSEMARKSSTANLSGFCHYAPKTLVAIALSDFQSTHWDHIPLSEPLHGATWVAARCGEISRHDLKAALITTLLRRKNPRDFPPQGMSLSNVAWLLKNVPAEGSELVPAFLEALCTKTWLGSNFGSAPCGVLASALRMLALFQSPEVCGHFCDGSLNIRVETELARFSEATPEERSHIIQLLGSGVLAGLHAKRDWFSHVRLDDVGVLPVQTLPHRDEATKVEDWQFQLWLGLRAVTEAIGTALEVPSAVILRTANLWRCNLAEASIGSCSEVHRVNSEMCTWLEICARADRGLLLPPSTEH